MDRLDRKILRLLTGRFHAGGGRPGQESRACRPRLAGDGSRRWKRTASSAAASRLLDPVKVNTKVTVFVSIRTNAHSIEWLKRFSEVVAEFPEVVEFYRMSGDVDYLLRVVVPDIAAYDAFYKRLIANIEIRDVSSAFAMEQIKYTTELPLDYMGIENVKSGED